MQKSYFAAVAAILLSTNAVEGQTPQPTGSDADTTNKCLSREKDASILSWPTIIAHLKLCIAVFTA
eukprot:scaffold23165_cov83-Skeletonema_dohrnii-CCMP3373.AAC.4